jgi:hypothetical protein
METDLLDHATEFSFMPAGATWGDRDVDYFTVRASWCAEGRWAVFWMGRCWNKNTRQWQFNPAEPNRQYLADCRFSRDEAVRIARELPNVMTVMGKDWAAANAARTGL